MDYKRGEYLITMSWRYPHKWILGGIFSGFKDPFNGIYYWLMLNGIQ
jgi:hypothetical protein